jgi:hypothetical protein
VYFRYRTPVLRHRPCNRKSTTQSGGLGQQTHSHNHRHFARKRGVRSFVNCFPSFCWLAPRVRRPFAKFVESPYYFESEFCGGAVTVSFSKYHPWQAMHFLQRSTHFSKTCCMLQTVDHFKISCFGAPFSWLEKPRNRMEWDLNWILCSAWKK